MKHRKFIKVVSVILLVAFITGIVNTGAMPVKVSAAETGTNTINWSGTVTPDKVWIITYNSAVNVSTVNSNTIKVLDSSGKEIPLSITVGIDGVSVSAVPVTPYAAGSYSLRVLSGINSISGVNLSNGLTINFTVAGKVTPDGIAITPQGLALSPGGTARFTAALIGAPITGTFMWSVLGEGTAGSNGTGISNAGSGTGAGTGAGTGTGANTGTSAADVNNGSISPQGDYLAPMDPGTYYIIAESIEYPGLKEIAGITVQTPPASPVDFMISNEDLDLPSYVTPGSYVSLKARVHNLTPSIGKAGGSVARFYTNGRIIDEVPFYMGNNESYVDVTAHYYLPEGDYGGLPQNQQLPAKVDVFIDPYNKTRETNENNNTATSQFNVKGAYDISLDDTQPGLTIDPSGLSAWSMKYDALEDKISAALPGQKLKLKARLRYTSTDSSEEINVKFIINGIVIKDDNKQIGKPASGYHEVNEEYYVPMNISEPIDFRVLLSNGSEARIEVPIYGLDTCINAGDLSWSGETVATPGKTLYLKAILKNPSALEFPNDFMRVAYRVLVDGVIIYEKPLHLSTSTLYPSPFIYKVPENRTKPILFTVVTDPYDQIAETDETNNIASISIPVQNNGVVGPAFSISASDLSYTAKPLVPGSHVELWAAIKNNSKTIPTKDLRVLFKINGNVIFDFKVRNDILNPLQYELLSKSWTVPQDMAANPVFQVVLDPSNEFGSEDDSDNNASITMQMVKPDLDVTGTPVSWLPENPKAGQKATLTAYVRNSGIAPARNSKVKFILDGNTVGETTIPIISGASASTATYEWQIPEATDLAQLPWTTLQGATGKLPLPTGITRDYKYKIQADAANLIIEANEENNISDEKILTVYIPYDKRVVYVKTDDVLGNVSSAEVELKASGGETIKALTGEDGWCTFTGVPLGAYTITIKQDGYKELVKNVNSTSGNLALYHQLFLERTAEMVGLAGKDTDGDLLSDENELLYRTLVTDSDTDNDGVLDGKDLSPLMDPAEPSFLYLQKVGMVRLEQPIAAYGLDGWVEVWDMDFQFSSMSDKLVYSQTYENQGTRYSDMSDDTIKKAVNNLFQGEKFKVHSIKNITPSAIGYADTELTHDLDSEDKYIFPADHTHRTEYRFYYDYITDYQSVSLKNFDEVLYPSADNYFSYLLAPVKIKTGKSHSYSFQFRQAGLSDSIYHTDDTHYKDMGFQYSFYKTDNFDDDANIPYCQGIALADCDGDLFSFAVNLPSERANYATSYLKITPVWVEKNGWKQNITPLMLSWNMTGITREVVYTQNSEGNMKNLKEEFNSIYGLNTDIMDYSAAMTYGNPADARKSESWAGLVNYDPNDPLGDKYHYAEMTLKILSYADKGLSGVDKVFTAIEKIVTKKNKAKEVENLPTDHWMRQPRYGTILASVAIVQGVVTIYTNGIEAWTSYKEGDGIACVYYSAKAAAAGAQTAANLAKISKNIVAWSGKTGRFAKLASDKVGVGIAVATGLIEVGYNAARWATTTDSIQKSAYGEKVFESVIDTGLAVVAVLYAPFIAFQATWMIGVELYGLVAGNNLAYRVAKSPSTAVVFIFNYWAENVPSQIAEDAYTSIKDDLMEYLDGINSYQKPFIAVFIDPQL